MRDRGPQSRLETAEGRTGSQRKEIIEATGGEEAKKSQVRSPHLGFDCVLWRRYLSEGRAHYLFVVFSFTLLSA